MTMQNDEINRIIESMTLKYDQDAESFWNQLSYSDKCNAFHAVVKRLVQGELVENGSYRRILYNTFGFQEDMYTRGMDCGFMELHNSIDVKHRDTARSKRRSIQE
jgi:hypothetical protein